MRLCLVRHAPAGSPDLARWPDDADRPLTPRVRERFERAARGVRALGIEVDLVLSSGYRRAWETAVLLHEHAGWVAPQRLDAIVEEPAEAVLETLRRRLDSELASVALVGHEPGMNELASLLIAGDASAVAFEWRRGAMALIELEEFEPGAGTLGAFLPPRALRAAASASIAASG